MKHRSRSLGAVLAALAAGGACSVYGPEDLPLGGSGSSSGGKATAPTGGRSFGGTAGTNSGGTLSAGGAGDGGQGDTAGVDAGGAGAGGVSTGGGPAEGGSSHGGTGAGGSASGGTASGGTSGGATSAGASSVAPEVIDNMEDGDDQIFPQLKRDGYWYTSADSAGSTVDPAPTVRISMPNLPSGEAGSGVGRHAFHFIANGGPNTSTAWGALGGFDFLRVAEGLKQPYDAHIYKGIRFWAKATSNVVVRVRVPLRDTTSDAQGSKCGTKCDDHYLKSQEITPTWTEYVMRWADFQQLGWGMPVSFDPATLIGVHFVVGPNLNGDIWIDDVSFIP